MPDFSSARPEEAMDACQSSTSNPRISDLLPRYRRMTVPTVVWRSGPSVPSRRDSSVFFSLGAPIALFGVGMGWGAGAFTCGAGIGASFGPGGAACAKTGDCEGPVLFLRFTNGETTRVPTVTATPPLWQGFWRW